jgi:hypothetical protein
MKEDMDGASIIEMQNAHTVLGRKSDGMRPLGNSRHRGVDIKMDLKEKHISRDLIKNQHKATVFHV